MNVCITMLSRPGAVTCHCEHCGESFDIVVPMTVQNFLFLLRDFMADHRDCEQPEHRDAGTAADRPAA